MINETIVYGFNILNSMPSFQQREYVDLFDPNKMKEYFLVLLENQHVYQKVNFWGIWNVFRSTAHHHGMSLDMHFYLKVIKCCYNVDPIKEYVLEQALWYMRHHHFEEASAHMHVRNLLAMIRNNHLLRKNPMIQKQIHKILGETMHV